VPGPFGGNIMAQVRRSQLRTCRCGGLCPVCFTAMRRQLSTSRRRMDELYDLAVEMYRDTVARWARDSGFDEDGVKDLPS